MITVTKTYLPSVEEYNRQLQKIWRSGWVTNSGSLVKELAGKLRTYLQVPNMELVANGTLALQLAIRALGLKGEIITTPFSYVATTTAILWEGCQPVFVDIEEKTFCIDADKIEAAVSPRTTAILATHIYGFPCNVQKIERIARKYKLKVIYDAAHAFGVKLNGKSLSCYGDITALSFHAAKLFHTAEGGGVVCKNERVAKRISLIKKFGHIGEEDYREIGINAKMSELHAAMGLCVLPKVSSLIASYRKVSRLYDRLLEGSGLIHPKVPQDVEYNYSFYPVIFPTHNAMTRVRKALRAKGIGPRRYFYPSLNQLPYLAPKCRRPCLVSEDISSRVLCLPVSFDLRVDQVTKVAEIIRKNRA